MSVVSDVYAGLKTLIQGLSLSGFAGDDIVVRKLPRIDESLDSVPKIIIAPAQNADETVVSASFEDEDHVTYPIDIVIVTAGNQSLDQAGLTSIQGHRTSIRAALRQMVLSGVSGLLKIDVEPDVAIDEDKISSNYDYSPIRALVTVTEARAA